MILNKSLDKIQLIIVFQLSYKIYNTSKDTCFAQHHVVKIPPPKTPPQTTKRHRCRRQKAANATAVTIKRSSN